MKGERGGLDWRPEDPLGTAVSDGERCDNSNSAAAGQYGQYRILRGSMGISAGMGLGAEKSGSGVRSRNSPKMEGGMHAVGSVHFDELFLDLLEIGRHGSVHSADHWVWDNTTQNYTVPSGYTSYLDLAGVCHTVPGDGIISVTEEPVLVQDGVTCP